jgi:hypothetical protein
VQKIKISDALDFFVNLNLSKRQYIEIKNFLKSSNCDLLPCYDILSASKEVCYPKDIIVSGDDIKATLQSTIDHIINRTILFYKNELLEKIKPDTNELICYADWNISGDGSSHHSEYHQELAAEIDDSHMFSSSCTLLRISSPDFGTLFINPSPASPRFCVPFWLNYVKEDVEEIKEHYNVIINEISNLKPISIDLNENVKISIVKSNFVMGGYDGKCVSVLCNSSTQSCSNCLSTPTEMALMENIENGKFDFIDSERKFTVNFGFPLLHAQIQIFNFFLNIGSKLIIKNGRGGKMQVVKENRDLIRDRFHDEFNLIVDRPNLKTGGNFTTGNVARRAFGDINKFSRCLGFGVNGKIILERVNLMLIALKSKRRLNIENFRNYGIETYKLYLNEFSWHRPSPYFHRLCIHVADIANSLPLPIAFFNEEANENRNKDLRKFRLERARKTSRKENILDVMNRCWLQSDYFISLGHQPTKKKEIPLPDIVENFLLENFQRNEENSYFYEEIEEEEE